MTAATEIYLVMGETGVYDNRGEWPVMAFGDEESAENYVLFLNRERDKHPSMAPYNIENRRALKEHMRAFDPGFEEENVRTTWSVHPLDFHAGRFPAPPAAMKEDQL